MGLKAVANVMNSVGRAFSLLFVLRSFDLLNTAFEVKVLRMALEILSIHRTSSQALVGKTFDLQPLNTSPSTCNLYNEIPKSLFE